MFEADNNERRLWRILICCQEYLDMNMWLVSFLLTLTFAPGFKTVMLFCRKKLTQMIIISSLRQMKL